MVLGGLFKGLLVLLHDAPLNELPELLGREALIIWVLLIDHIGYRALDTLPRLGIVLVHCTALTEEPGGLHEGLQLGREPLVVLLSSFRREVVGPAAVVKYFRGSHKRLSYFY